MSQIAYDPVKDRLAAIIRHSGLLRTLFYVALDVFFLRSWHIRRKLRLIFRGNPKKLRILDAGNGFGQYDRFMLRNLSVDHILAVDVKADYLEDCRLYFKDEIAQGRIILQKQDLLEFTAPGYDLVLCVDVLEHIEEDVKVMRNMMQSLRPGGYFLMHSPSHLAEEDAGEDAFFVDEHARAGYSAQELRSKFRQAGLQPLSLRYTYGPAGHTAWVILIKWPMLLLNKLGFGAILLLPLWYLVSFLPGMLLNWLDTRIVPHKGTGIMGFARKPELG
ncbi:MAG: class I SAM-dependent methyltransferase [Candidatus Cyclonatronum sp.]|uniref:class I SAM-dependent methyltransferase n=1 Tax=Cyclonatronum sp. TaxID=3024185 RepID=UPI0025C5094F|nr:class I SAM-dependent methyltransferase [Cyclonatronum sp.]MCC5935334.1 class I SAM-dependent methyltransferase [Balneolales bacterium]MCH8487967.1 class I SAM-dependent methyltransferase [Cyclonatronum sp.]